MKKNTNQFLRIVVCFSILLVVFTACGSKRSSQKVDKGDVTIYYLNQTKTSLYPVGVKMKEKTTPERIHYLITKLSTNVEDADYTNPIPDSVSVRHTTLKGRKLTVSFSRDYQTLNSEQEALLRAAVVKTLIQLRGIDSISFKIVDEALLDGQGSPIGAMTADSFVDDFGSEQDSAREAELTLFYPVADGSGICREVHDVHYNENVPLAQVVLRQLGKKPETADALPAIPSNVKVLSVNTSDGVCYVDLDQSLFNNETVSYQKMAIYSIVNSLCKLDQINRVQIMIGSGENATILESDDLSNTFAADESFVLTQSGTSSD